MSSLPYRRQIVLLLSLCLLATVAQAKSVSKLESLGGDTFAITRTATNGFDRDVQQFIADAKDDAAKYCADNGKVMKLVSTTSERPFFGNGFSSAKVVFKALPAGDPALTAAEPVIVAGAPAVAGALPTQAGDLYTEILKLDDLRKRGLLTDKEFEQQKKKLLKKSN